MNSAAASEPAGPSGCPSATRDSGGTVTVRSPGMASRSRLVASTVRSAQLASSFSTNGGDHLEQVLAVVEHQQRRAAGQVLVQRRVQRPARPLADAEQRRDGLADEPLAHRDQVDEHGAGRVPRRRGLGRPGRQPGLAHAAGADQGHHPAAGQGRQYRGLLPVPADEAGPGRGQPGHQPGRQPASSPATCPSPSGPTGTAGSGSEVAPPESARPGGSARSPWSAPGRRLLPPSSAARASNSRSAGGNSRASAISRTVDNRGAFRRPCSIAATVAGLIRHRPARASWVRLAATRNRRSNSPKDSAIA